MSHRSVLIIYTGGTIGMIHHPSTGALVPVDFGEITTQLPELNKFDFKIHTQTFSESIDSSNINPAFWVELARMIKDAYSDFDGFVILHGTDTMAYSASAMSFILENLDKPVVFTGSQLPIGVLRTDGKENLLTALEIAAGLIDDQPVVPEVSIFFQNQLFRGNRTRKHNADYFNAFTSENYPVLAEAGIDIHYNHEAIWHPVNHHPLIIHTKLDSSISLLKLFPGIQRESVSAILNIPNQRAVVLESFGSGNAPTASWFLNEIEGAINAGKVVLNITQCSAGSVRPGTYETNRLLHEIGVINGRDMTTEAAVTKLMFLLGEHGNQKDIITYLNRSISGEITV